MESSQTDIPQEAKQAADRGDMIEAIKSTRIETGLGLKESKEAVERYLAAHPGTSEQFRAAGGRTGIGPGMIVAMVLLMAVAVLVVIYLSGAWR